MTDIIERAEAAIVGPWVGVTLPYNLLAEAIAELKAARAESQSHQETIMHANDALSMIRGESRRQLDEIKELKADNQRLREGIQRIYAGLGIADD